MPDAPSSADTTPETPDPSVAAEGSDETAAASSERSPTIIRLALVSATLGILTCLGLALLIYVHLEDEAYFEDDDLVTVAPAPVEPDENAGPLVRRAIATLSGREFYDTKVPGGEPLAAALAKSRFGSFAVGGDPEPVGGAEAWAEHPFHATVSELLSESAPFFEFVDDAIERPHCLLPEPYSALHAAEQSFGKYRAAWQLLQLRADVAFEVEDFAATRAADRAQLLYAGLLADGTRSMIQKSTALTQVHAALATIGRHLDAGVFDGAEGDLRSTIDRLLDAIDRGEASEAVRTEYRVFKRRVEDAPQEMGKSDGDSPEIAFLFHPNETLRILGTYYRAAIEEGERTGRVIETEPPTVRSGVIERLLHGNGIGHLLLELAPLELDSIYARTDEVIEALEALRARVDAKAGTDE